VPHFARKGPAGLLQQDGQSQKEQKDTDFGYAIRRHPAREAVSEVSCAALRL
jgi:hypothetical protein